MKTETHTDRARLAHHKTLKLENKQLREALASLLPLAAHTSPQDVAVHTARALLEPEIN